MTRHDEPGDAVADPKKHRFPSSDGAAQPLADEHQGAALPAIQLTGAWVIALWLGVYEVGLGVLVATRYGDTVFDTVEGSLQISLIFSAPAIWLLTDRLLVRIPQVIDRLLGVIGRALPQAQHLIDRLIRHWQATVKARHRRAARRRRQTGWRLVLGPRTAWERLATHRSFGDQLADVGVRIAVSSAVVLGVVFAQTQTPPRSSTTGDSSTYWFLAVAVVVFAPAVIAMVRWSWSILTAWLALWIIFSLMGAVDLSVLQRDWNVRYAERIVEFVLLEPLQSSTPASIPVSTSPVQALDGEPAAESIYITCRDGQAVAIGPSVRTSWTAGEIADLSDVGVWRVREVVVVRAPKPGTLQRRLDARC